MFIISTRTYLPTWQFRIEIDDKLIFWGAIFIPEIQFFLSDGYVWYDWVDVIVCVFYSYCHIADWISSNMLIAGLESVILSCLYYDAINKY